MPGSYVKLKRYDGYKPNTQFRAAHRLRRLQAGLLRHGDLPHRHRAAGARGRPADRRAAGRRGRAGQVAARRSKNDKNITILPLQNWWIQIAHAEHLGAADRQPDVPQGGAGGAGHGRDHGCRVGRQLPAECRLPVSQPGRSTPMPARRPTTCTNPALAKKYLAQSGYKGEPVVLLTDKDYAPMYNSALVMQQELQAIGINAQLKVVDWPTSVQHGAEAPTPAGTSSTPAGARSRRWARWRPCSSWSAERGLQAEGRQGRSRSCWRCGTT